MDEVIRYVDTASAGGNGTTSELTGENAAYASLFAWEAAENVNLFTAGNWHHVYVKATNGDVDSTAVTIDGWTTGEANYILIEAADSDKAVKTSFDTSKYRLTAILSIAEDYVRILGVQFANTSTYSNCISYGGIGATNDIRIERCRIRADATGTEGIYFADADAILTLNNNIIESTGTYGNMGIRIGAGTVNVYNNAVIGFSDDGINIASGATVVIKNNAIFNNADDIADAASSTIEYNAADDDLDTEYTETTNIQPAGAWTNEFASATDLTLLVGSALKLAGVGPGTDAAVPVIDIDGTTRSGATTSIGPDEYEETGSSVMPVAMQYYRRLHN